MLTDVPSSLPVIGHVCAALSALIAGISEIHRKDYPQMDQTISGTVLQVSSVPCIHLAPQYILLGMAEAFVTPACKHSFLCTNLYSIHCHCNTSAFYFLFLYSGSVIAFCLTPINLRGISLHFLTLFYGGGCFLGALLIQFFYFVSGGKDTVFTSFNNSNM